MADPDFELRRGAGFISLAQPASLPSVISSFFTQNKGEARASPLDPPLVSDASLFYLNSLSTDGPDNSLSQSFRAAVNLCATYAPYTQETEFGLQDLYNRAGILFMPFHGN